ncbi:M20/M25/M40 family metallo-hydrolase [Sediminicola sp. 1XM1-17]|uniref:M20/M25/M40 family metallo-hydrolase n=1 Tax=Sediminicola sp. 1XM1-17 TaxID=3127702 RepID=UPI00307808BD
MKKQLLPLLIFLLSVNLLIGQEESATKVQPPYQNAIDKLIKKKNIQQAFSIIDELEPVTHKNLVELTEIPAPPFMEHKRAERFSEMLREAGADTVWIDEVGNVLALRKGKDSNKTVALDAHLDTVFPEETDVVVKMVGDTLYAPGVGDDTRGLAMVLTVLKAMNSAKIKTTSDVLLVGTVGEEGLGDLRGVKHLFKKNEPKIDSWIAIDGGELGRINNQALGSYRYKITFKGPGGHSWGAFGLANPHHAAGRAVAYFDDAARTYTASGPKTSYNIGRIGGGTSINSIPFESWMEVDMRSVSPTRLNEIEEILISQTNKALEDYNNMVDKGPKLTVAIEKIGDRPSGELSPELPLIQRAMAVTKAFKTEPFLTRGSTDSNIPISLGIPAVTIGRGGKAGGAHSLGEWWLNDETGPESIKLALLILVAEAGIE